MMSVRTELAIPDQSLDGFTLEHRIVAVDVVEDLGFQNEESRVHPPNIFDGFLAELAHGAATVLDVDDAKSARVPHRGHRRDLVLPSVQFDHLVDRNVTDSVS